MLLQTTRAFIQALVSAVIFPQKIQFLYCYLIHYFIEGNIFEIYVFRSLENTFLTLFLNPEA